MSSAFLVEPAYRSFPVWAATDGPAVGELCASYAGFTPDAEQQMALDALFAVDEKGRSAAFEFAVVCCRQNLKTGLFKMAALGWLFYTDQRLVVWSAHEFRTAQEAFRDMDELIGSSDYLRKRVKAVYYGNSDKSIELFTGQRLIFKARTGSGGRGLTGDKIVLDEAFALQPSHMGALLPTLSARPDPQVVYGSSAGQADSDVLRAIRDRGRPGGDPSLAYLEWCAPDPFDVCADGGECMHELGRAGCGCDDPDNWRRANPQAGKRISMEYIAAERRALPPVEFGRERMGWWDDPSGESAIHSMLWAQRVDQAAQITGAAVFALDVSPKMTHAAIGVSGDGPSGLHCGLLHREGQELVDSRPGTDWVLPALKDLKTRQPGLKVVMAGNGQAKSLAPDLEAAGIDVELIPAGDVAAACGLMFKLATGGGLTHSGQPELDAAVGAAQWRDTGEGAQVFGRRKSGEITPLYAATLAVWVANRTDQLSPINNIW